jgi:hypothetical protein
MNNNQFRDLTREFLQNLGGGLPEEDAAPSGVLTEQGGARPVDGQVRQSWDQLMAALELVKPLAEAFNRTLDSSPPGTAVDETGFTGTEANQLSDLLQDVWEGAGFHADELFKGHR